jgi:hypothetical protein
MEFWSGVIRLEPEDAPVPIVSPAQAQFDARKRISSWLVMLARVCVAKAAWITVTSGFYVEGGIL